MELFFELLQIAVGCKSGLNFIPSEEDWDLAFKMAKEQAVVGILLSALELLAGQGIKPPLNLLYEWIGLSEQIKHRNQFLNRKCVCLMNLFADAGYDSCILKGQGNALMYPEPLLRSSGDIDIWVKGNKRDIIEFCRNNADGCVVGYYHIQFPIWPNVEVEVHFTPSYSIVPRFSKLTRQFFSTFKKEEINNNEVLLGSEKIFIPSGRLNLVFQMSHMARHFFWGGIGMRQILDYYFLLKYYNNRFDSTEIVELYRKYGLYKFASSVIWVLNDIFGLRETVWYDLADEKRGKLLLNEIINGGNFGFHDKRFSSLKRKSFTLSAVCRNFRIIHLFPEEAFWAPLIGAWYFIKNKRL